MALTIQDRRLIQRCLEHDSQAWQEFVDRFAAVVHQVIVHTIHLRNFPMQPAEIEDLTAEVMAEFVRDDFAVLRRFRGNASLTTYLAVVARRVVLHQILKSKKEWTHRMRIPRDPVDETIDPELHIDNEDEVWEMLKALDGREAELVRGFYIENKSYKQISLEQGIPENSIGPMLARIRARLRNIAPREV